jgi:hypothetical protein
MNGAATRTKPKTAGVSAKKKVAKSKTAAGTARKTAVKTAGKSAASESPKAAVRTPLAGGVIVPAAKSAERKPAAQATDSQKRKTAKPAEPAVDVEAPVNAVSAGGIEERIRSRAYELWEQRGRVHGHAVEDWLQAEKEIAEVTPKAAGVRRGKSRRAQAEGSMK